MEIPKSGKYVVVAQPARAWSVEDQDTVEALFQASKGKQLAANTFAFEFATPEALIVLFSTINARCPGYAPAYILIAAERLMKVGPMREAGEEGEAA